MSSSFRFPVHYLFWKYSPSLSSMFFEGRLNSQFQHFSSPVRYARRPTIHSTHGCISSPFFVRGVPTTFRNIFLYVVVNSCSLSLVIVQVPLLCRNVAENTASNSHTSVCVPPRPLQSAVFLPILQGLYHLWHLAYLLRRQRLRLKLPRKS